MPVLTRRPLRSGIATGGPHIFREPQGSTAPLIRQSLHNSVSGGSASIVTAASTVTGDLLVCFYGSNFFTLAAMGTPTGTAGTWTLETTADQGTNAAHMKCFTRPVTVDGAQTVTVPANGTAEVFQFTYVIVAGTWDSVDVKAGNQGAASTSHVAPSLTPNGATDLLLCAWQSGSGSSPTYTLAPVGMNQFQSESASSFDAMGSAVLDLLDASATGTKTAICSGSVTFAAISIAVKNITPAGVDFSIPHTTSQYGGFF